MEGQRWLNELESADETEFEVNDNGAQGGKERKARGGEQTWD